MERIEVEANLENAQRKLSQFRTEVKRREEEQGERLSRLTPSKVCVTGTDTEDHHGDEEIELLRKRLLHLDEQWEKDNLGLFANMATQYGIRCQ